nr:hypothetical protein CFP56_60882 [Quercus suber]
MSQRPSVPHSSTIAFGIHSHLLVSSEMNPSSNCAQNSRLDISRTHEVLIFTCNYGCQGICRGWHCIHCRRMFHSPTRSNQSPHATPGTRGVR